MPIFCANKQTSCQVRHFRIIRLKDKLLWGNANLMIWIYSRVNRQFGTILDGFDSFEQVRHSRFLRQIAFTVTDR